MIRKLKFSALGVALICTLAALSGTALAQSTIFNIPSTDVVAKKKTYFEFDFIGHLESDKNGGFQTYVPRVVFGLPKNVEVGVNVAATHSAAPAIVYVQPNIKWQFYANEKAGTAFTAGAIAYTPLTDRKTIDKVFVLLGAAMAVVLVVAGGLLWYAHNFATNSVRTELSAQKVYFPPKGSPGLDPAEFPDLQKYAGQQVNDGPKAKAYANGFIGTGW